MKVAFVVHQFLPRYTTGTERYAYTLAQGLLERGVTVAVFSGEDTGKSLLAEDDYSVGGLHVHRVTRHRSLEADSTRGEYASFLTEAAFARFLEAERPDVVHFFHVYNLGGRLMDAARAHGVPYFVHLMDYWFLCPRIQMLDHEGELCGGPTTAERCARCASEVDGNYRPLAEGADASGLVALDERWPWLRERLEQATGVFAPSIDLRDRFAENGFDAGRMHHLPYGVAIESKAPAAPTARGEGEVRFGYLGNLATFKGAHLALEAFARLEGEHLRLQVFGDFFFREPEQMEACRRRVDSDPRITLCGRYEHEELAAILAELDVVVVPSLWHENTPFVVLETLRSGTPVIASRVGGIAEAVRENVDGFLFERGDVEDLVRKMQRFAAGDGPAKVEADHIPAPEDNVEALLGHYQAARAGFRPVEGREAARLRAALRDGLYRAMEGLGARLLEAGGEAERGRDVVETLRDAGRLRAELEGHRAALAERASENERLRRDVDAIESQHREQIEARDRRFEVLAADLDGHRTKLEQVAADLESHRAELKRLTEEGEVRAVTETTLREDLARHREVVTELTTEREHYEKVVTDLEQDLNGHREALAATRLHVAETTEAREACEARLVEVSSELQSAEARCTRARDAIGEQAAAIRRLDAELEIFAAEIDTTAQGRNL